ncbi:MAG TPA: hypothetical protein VJX67_15855 [Blastocatellia bacterium]|nr:hypothetical protein [Blastocatellia bacterium]
MKKELLLIGLVLLGFSADAQQRGCLRIMPPDELTRHAAFIGRAKIVRVEKVNYRGMYSQIAVVAPGDVIQGDFTLRTITILGGSNVPCAEDTYTAGQEMLIFLAPEDSLYRTVNFQYGKFPIAGDIVKGWRNKANKPVDTSYGEVKQEVEAYINAQHPGPAPPAPKPQPAPPRQGALTPANPKQDGAKQPPPLGQQ